MSTNNSAAAVDDAVIQRTVQALSERNMPAVVAESGEHALQLLKDMIPEGAEVFNSTSETLDTIGYSDYLHNNPRYRNLHDEVAAETDPVKLREKRRLATVSEYIIGSVQAISETGEIVVASGSGSQLGAFVFGAKYVILVAGTQKICPTLSDAIDRTRGYTLDRHDEWLQAQGRGARPVGKLAILENEVGEGRVRVILIKQNLGW
ncbi:MAG TPA: hypothetical protein DCM17_07390 [Dehalococcoidia bacterium]|nr:hypothetical protein [Dehalococcoidia bacterium]|tara:strand:- start:1186 stop:1803 length:618 start_codon:yes stop_codon:yes gene_type:complete